MSKIELNAISKSFGAVEALAATTLTIASGQFTVLLGPSGCGKSTTLRLLAGLDLPTSGQIFIDGRDVTAASPAQRGIAMVFQNYALFPHLTVADNILFGLQVRGTPAAECKTRLADTAELLGLTALLARKPSQLSGGQQQRVALGRALVSQAKICLMDEPLSNLDAKLRQEMRSELRSLQQKLKLTLVYVTHDQSEAMSMGDQVVLLEGGRVVQSADPRTLYAHPATTFAARFIGTPPMNLLRTRDGCIAGTAIPAAQFAGTQILGIRPEDVQLDSAGIPALVDSLEYLGADQVVRCRVGEETVSIRLAGGAQVAVGARIGLKFPASAIRIFDPESLRAVA